VNKYFAHLRPLERRLAVGVLVVVIVVLNAWLIWPHFSDWSRLEARLKTARLTLANYQTAVAQATNYEAQVKSLEGQGEFVAPEDQAINFMRTIQSQAEASGVGKANYSRSIMHTNDAFFIEQVQNINVVATDQQLVDFLYKLGSGASMIRVRDLELQPDGPRQHLNASIKLVASYQKNPAPPAATPAPVATPAPAVKSAPAAKTAPAAPASTTAPAKSRPVTKKAK
jgi:Tfp pilus assembly protein PilO